MSVADAIKCCPSGEAVTCWQTPAIYRYNVHIGDGGVRREAAYTTARRRFSIHILLVGVHRACLSLERRMPLQPGTNIVGVALMT